MTEEYLWHNPGQAWKINWRCALLFSSADFQKCNLKTWLRCFECRKDASKWFLPLCNYLSESWSPQLNRPEGFFSSSLIWVTYNCNVLYENTHMVFLHSNCSFASWLWQFLTPYYQLIHHQVTLQLLLSWLGSAWPAFHLFTPNLYSKTLQNSAHPRSRFIDFNPMKNKAAHLLCWSYIFSAMIPNNVDLLQKLLLALS